MCIIYTVFYISFAAFCATLLNFFRPETEIFLAKSNLSNMEYFGTKILSTELIH